MNHRQVRPRNPNLDNPIPTVMSRLRARPNAMQAARIVGCWVWVQFATKPDMDTRSFLIHEGFYWNRRRKVWQHQCATPIRRLITSPYLFATKPQRTATAA